MVHYIIFFCYTQVFCTKKSPFRLFDERENNTSIIITVFCVSIRYEVAR